MARSPEEIYEELAYDRHTDGDMNEDEERELRNEADRISRTEQNEENSN